MRYLFMLMLPHAVLHYASNAVLVPREEEWRQKGKGSKGESLLEMSFLLSQTKCWSYLLISLGQGRRWGYGTKSKQPYCL